MQITSVPLGMVNPMAREHVLEAVDKMIAFDADQVAAAFSRLIRGLKSKSEGAATVLDNTMVLFGSNLGNANSHDTRNLPVLLAGGGFRHGQYLAFDAQNNTPLCNLFVPMLQRMGMETDSFGSSTSQSIPGLTG